MGHRMPGEPNCIAYTACKFFKTGPIIVHPEYGCVSIVGYANIEWRTDGNIKLSIRTERNIFPTMWPLRWEFIVDDYTLRSVCKVLLDILEFDDLTDFCNIQRTIFKGYTIRIV